MKKDLKILCVGNSFSVDTMEHAASIVTSLGKTVKLGNLYIGGCSIRRHYDNAHKNAALYEYLVNDGDGWSSTFEHTIGDAVKSEDWDIISIQHGTADGSRNTEEEYYDKLPALVAYIRSLASVNTKIAFNMTWVGEPYHSHPEIVAHGGDTMLMYQKIVALTERVVVPTAGLDIVSPTGTAIQNARTVLPFELTRDGYHLSLDVGRYIAGLTFLKATVNFPIEAVTWAPGGVDDATRAVAINAAKSAIAAPFEVTRLLLFSNPFCNQST